MKLYCFRDTASGEYLCNGQWGEEPEWFSPGELSHVKVDRPSAVAEGHDHSPSEWA